MRQVLVSGFGGICATVVDVSALVLQVHHHTPIALAAFVAAALGAAVGFTINKYIAFRDRSPGSRPSSSARFGIVAVATALLMAGAMQLLAVKLAVPYLVAKLVCAVLVFVAWTYPAQRRLVFASSPSS